MKRQILLILTFIIFAGFYGQPIQKTAKNEILNAGFMYWYGPHILEAPWDAVISGTVTKVENYIQEYSSGSKIELVKGNIEIHEILLSI